MVIVEIESYKGTRDKHDIIRAILNACKNGCNASGLYQKANLCGYHFRAYISYLIKHKLLRRKKWHYFTTEKGEHLLEEYQIVEWMVRASC